MNSPRGGSLLLMAFVVAVASPHARAAEQTPRPKIAITDLRSVGTFDPQEVAGLAALIASEASQFPVSIVAGADLVAMIGFENQKQLLGCSDNSCLAELGGALGVDYLLVPEVSEVAGTWLLSMTLLNLSKAMAAKRVTRRTKDRTMLVDVTVEALIEVLGSVSKSAAPPLVEKQAPSPTPPPAPAPVVETPSPKAVAKAPAVPEQPSNTAGLMMGTSGLVLLAGGGVFGLLASQSFDEAKAETQMAPVDSGYVQSLRETTETRMLIADVLYGVGAVALMTGLYMHFTAEAVSPEPVAIAPVPGGFVVAGRF